jgi:competence protein ComEC
MKGRRPLTMPALFFGLGIALGAWFPSFPTTWSAAAAAVFLFFRCVTALAGRNRLAAAATAVLFIFLGTFRFQTASSPPITTGDNQPVEDAVVAGVVSGPPESRGETLIIDLEQTRVRDGGGPPERRGRIRVYLKRWSEKPVAGEVLVARGSLWPVRPARNLSWFPTPPVPSGRAAEARLFVPSPVWIRRQGSSSEGGIGEAVTRLRQGAIDFWDGKGGAEPALLKALTTGQRGSVPDDVRESFRRSGLAHLLAVSGLHLGFATLFVYLLFRKSLVWIEPLAARYAIQPLGALLTMPVLVFIYAFSGEQVSAGRAAIMTCLALGASVLCRKPDLLNLVACAALAMLTLEPSLLFSVAFQLSFAAVTSLALAAPRISRAPPPEASPSPTARLLRYGRGVLLASLVASAGTLPLVAFHFQRIPLAGPAANVLAVPLTGFAVLPLGWSALLAHAIWPAAGEVLAHVASLACGALITIAGVTASLPWTSLAVPRPPPVLTLLLLALTLALLAPAGRGKHRALAPVLAVVTLIAFTWWVGGPDRTELEAAFFDVGQGEAALVVLPGGERLLVDTGPSWEHGDAGRRIVVPALRTMGVTAIDYVVISHFHPDHCGGLASVLQEMRVGELWTSPFREDEVPAELSAAIRRWVEGGGRLRLLSAGDSWEGREGARIDVLSPPEAEGGRSGSERSVNDSSLVLLLRWRETALLMTGDAGAEPIREVARSLPAAGKNALLKVPHHGGRQGGTEELVRACAPVFAVISVGRNSYGHPAPETVASLRSSARVLRTDRDGAIFVRSTGEEMSVRTWREMAAGRSWAERLRWLFEGR